ncbi:hypothetical protein WA026_013475 [Henosepilachna vigintioctopunctata]|uniref:UDP-glucuronosyltransferase n=1 Tax=Henosepilachna vigintioctopunctata TaxID=420089 RepID=A0AAW1V7N7_9CUCU
MKILLVVIVYLGVSKAANILGIWFYSGKSHHILGEVLLKELARRGHNVTMVSTFPLKEPFPNYTDVYLTGMKEDHDEKLRAFLDMNKADIFTFLNFVLGITKAHTELTLVHPEMERLLESGTKFDVIITDWFLNFAIFYFGKLLNCPVIPLASLGTLSVQNMLTGNPDEPSYIPILGLEFPIEMSFFQRTFNGIVHLYLQLIGRSNMRYHQDLIKKHFNDTMTDEEMSDTLALVLSNGHYSFESPRPYVPNIIPVGGFHIEAPKKLPRHLQDFLDSADRGAIFFSLGTNVKSKFLPSKVIQDILKVFSKLPYKFIFKWEAEGIVNKPNNVLIQKWFPQNDILVHRNLKLFISHGGMLSTIEAMYHAVPVLGIPIYGDQRLNIPSAVKKGYALQLNLEDLNEETLYTYIEEIMTNPKYKEKVTQLSVLLKDQPLPPMDTAVFWVEHVIKHKGGSHLKNYGIKLTWYQYYMIDVTLFIVFILLSILLLIYVFIRELLIFIQQCIITERYEKFKEN